MGVGLRFNAVFPNTRFLENILVCAIFLLRRSDFFVLLVPAGVLVITQRMFHGKSHRKKLFLAVCLI